MRKAILVLGMHRSGTSALTRVLSLLGAALPKRVMPPAANNNEAGFWEPEQLVHLHDAMLAEAGSRWDDWRAFDPAALGAERLAHYKAEIARLIAEEYGDTPLIVIKDPRICRFTPLYADILAAMEINAYYVLATRNPLAVAASLTKRDGFTLGYSALVWLRHMLEAEHATRGSPRILLSYEELLRDWRGEINKITRALALSWPRSPDEAATEIEEHLSPQYQHNVADEAQLLADERVAQWVKDAYAALTALEQHVNSTAPLAVLDRVKAEFDAVAPIFGNLFYEVLSLRERTGTAAQKLADERSNKIAQLSAEVALRSAEIATREAIFAEEKASLQQIFKSHVADIEFLNQKLKQGKAEAATREAAFAREKHALQQITDQQAAKIIQLSSELEKYQLADARAQSEKDALVSQIHAIRQSRSWRITAPFRLARHLLRGDTHRFLSALRATPDMRAADVESRPYKPMRRFSAPTRLRLDPLNELEQVKEHGSFTEWRMTGNAPSFIIAGLDRQIAPGLYKFEFELNEPTSLFKPTLYLDAGQGFNESHTERLRVSNDKKHASAIFEIHQSIMQLRLDPSQSPGPLNVKRASLRRLSTTAYHLRQAARLAARRIRTPSDLYRLTSHSLTLLRSGGWPALCGVIVKNVHRMSNHIDPDSYADWVSLYDTITPAELAGMHSAALELPLKPLISVLMPVYNTPPQLLRQAIESVIAQTYPFWELCIADDASTQPHVRTILKRFASKDRRIKIIFRTKNGHICHASNSALELVAGEWVALLDHDDLLRQHALYEVACAINRRPDAELIYSDEDKIDVQGHRYDAFFKPDFAPETFRSKNYLNHLTVHRTENVRASGGWRPGYEGSQDYDLNLRVIERIDTKKIIHIPKILYHWRAVAGSTAVAGSEKNYAWAAGLKALEEHLRRTGIGGRMEDIPGTPFYRLHLDPPEPRPLVSLIIPTRDRIALLRGCVESIRSRTTYPNYEIIIADNESTDPEILDYFRSLKSQDNIRILRHEGPFNFSAINNQAVKQAHGNIIGLINNDIEVISPGWLDEMVSWANRPEVGCVGAKLYYANDRVQHAGVILGVGGIASHSHRHSPRSDNGYFGRLKIVQNLSAVTAACLVVRKEVYEEVGGLNEKVLQIAFNDVDFCLKVMKAGYRNVWTPFAELYHLESVSRGAENTPAKVARFNAEIDYMRKNWGELLQNDPFYSPNLTFDREDFSLAFPPRVFPCDKRLIVRT
jgi:glycosyltransferase involved in cell wall biosynthesis